MLTAPLSGVENMAVDMALMQHARDTGEAVFRIYSWAAPTVSFGRNQNVRGHYSPERMFGARVDVVRRPTGGRSILHDREITYSVTAPTPAGSTLRAAYAAINDMLLDVLNRLGADVTLAQTSGRAARPSAAPCFEAPGEGEMTAAGRKLVGSAQWRENGALLQHGSILVEDDQQQLGNFMTSPPAVIPAPATLRSLLGRAPSTAEVATCVASVVRERADRDAAELAAEPVIEAGRGYQELFSDDRWTWRR